MESIKTFLQRKDQYEQIEYANKEEEVLDILADDEIWLLQCPKSFDLSNIKNNKIKLPGKTKANAAELIAEGFNNPFKLSLAILTNPGKINLKPMKIAGTMILRNRIEMKKINNVGDNSTSKIRVPFPDDVKDRHPLFGVSYEDKINLKNSLKIRLKEADECSAKKIEYGTKGNNKRKDKFLQNNSLENSPTNKKIKVEYYDDESLNWLKNI